MPTSRQMQKVDAEKTLIKQFVYIEKNQLVNRQLYNRFSLKRIQKKYLPDVTSCTQCIRKRNSIEICSYKLEFIHL